MGMGVGPGAETNWTQDSKVQPITLRDKEVRWPSLDEEFQTSVLRLHLERQGIANLTHEQQAPQHSPPT